MESLPKYVSRKYVSSGENMLAELLAVKKILLLLAFKKIT